jgi:hypothetical protein
LAAELLCLSVLWKTAGVVVRSATEDFEGTTLRAVSGLLEKLHYLARLHDGHGNYSHWGMERVYGVEVAARVIRSSHVAVFTRVLRTPFRNLIDDVSCSASSLHVTASEFLHLLNRMPRQLLPERSMTASQKHLMAVLHALSALVESQERATRPIASPLRPLAR